MGLSPRLRTAIHDFDWDICPLPTGPAGGQSMVKGNQLVIYKESEHPEAAWRFMRFLTSPQVELLLYGKLRRNFPTRIAVAHSKQFLDATAPPYHTRVFLNAVEHARQLPIDERWSEWTQALTSEQDVLYAGIDRDAGACMRRAAVKIDKVLNEEEGF